MGFGVSKAGAEAQALTEALSNYDDLDRALAAYNSERQPLSERIVLPVRSSPTTSRTRKMDWSCTATGVAALLTVAKLIRGVDGIVQKSRVA
jgi:hypothetical protein